MSQTDDKNPQRRYRAEVKRAKIVRKRDLDADRQREAKAQDSAPILPEEPQAQPEPKPEPKPEQVLPPEPEKIQTADSADTAESAPADGDNTQSGHAPLPDAENSIEYVMPRQSYKEHHSRNHVSSHEGKTKTASREERKEADSGYVFLRRRRHKKKHHHRRRRRRRENKLMRFYRGLPKWKRVAIVVTAIILVLILSVTGIFLMLREIGRRSMAYDDFNIDTPAEDESGNEIIKVDKNGRVITYKGVSYELNEDNINLTFIGIDDGDGENAELRMSDAIYIMALDSKTGALKVLGVSRDTMADVDRYNDKGEFVDTSRMQMAFTYSFDNDKVPGGKNTNTSLSRIFYGLPLKDYFAIDLDALLTINDTIGGVTVTSLMTFVSPEDGRTIQEGETVTLHGKEAERYVRTRDTSQLESNADRMQRQQQYIRAFMDSVIPAVKKDPSLVSKLYGEIKDHSETTLNLSKITYIASTAATKLKDVSEIEYLSLKGTYSKGKYAEMNVSDEEALVTMLDVFYKPLANVPEISSQPQR